MTTLEPGAIVVLTQGLVVRPLSTALRASRPAASITDGFDVFVQLVMAAMTTWPWSMLNDEPSRSATGATFLGRPLVAGSSGPAVGSGRPAWSPSPSVVDGGSLAGNDSSEASSTVSASGSGSDFSSAGANKALDWSSGTRSWGRAGPARLGTIVDRSSSSVSVNMGSRLGSCQRPCSLA